MHRCLELAQKGAGEVAPNPMVGAVIVCNGEIIGEGYHEKYGEAHAETNAIDAVKDKSLLSKSTLYVNLEPCSHYGKTPPCALRIIDCGIPRVVIGHGDPFPKVAGGGVKMLRENGIEVITDVLHAECAEINKRFFTFHEKKRPYIILKWAQSADGFIDKIRENNKEKPIKISNESTSQLNHQLRTEETAIMVGTRTALLDNPKLVARLAKGKNPVRVVIDRSLKIPKDYNLFNNEAETLVFTESPPKSPLNGGLCGSTNNLTSYLSYSPLEGGGGALQILAELHRRNLISLIVEGGAMLLQSFIDEDLWDEIYVETAENLVLENGVKSPELKNVKLREEKRFGENVIRTFVRKKIQ